MRARANRIARASAVPESAEPGATSGSCRMALFHCSALENLRGMMDYRSSGVEQAGTRAQSEGIESYRQSTYQRSTRGSRTTCMSGGVFGRIVDDDLLRWTVCGTDRSNHSRADTRFPRKVKNIQGLTRTCARCDCVREATMA